MFQSQYRIFQFISHTNLLSRMCLTLLAQGFAPQDRIVGLFFIDLAYFVQHIKLLKHPYNIVHLQ